MEKEAEDEEERVSEMTKMSMAQCSVKALDRSEWRHGLQPLRRDGTLID